ncbi:MAG: glucokinase, partial [Anaerolineales bacterium]|nr:glucokinase [Anaerolineales bacterium]
MEVRYLAGDIGGTKTRLALFSPESGACQMMESETYLSQDHSSLEEILRVYLHDKPYQLSGASFGIAGPIIGGRARVTNLEWV